MEKSDDWRVGDQVCVWSQSQRCWFHDGVVVEVLTVPELLVSVEYEAGYAQKTLTPNGTWLRRPQEHSLIVARLVAELPLLQQEIALAVAEEESLVRARAVTEAKNPAKTGRFPRPRRR